MKPPIERFWHDRDRLLVNRPIDVQTTPKRLIKDDRSDPFLPFHFQPEQNEPFPPFRRVKVHVADMGDDFAWVFH